MTVCSYSCMYIKLYVIVCFILRYISVLRKNYHHTLYILFFKLYLNVTAKGFVLFFSGRNLNKPSMVCPPYFLSHQQSTYSNKKYANVTTALIINRTTVRQYTPFKKSP